MNKRSVDHTKEEEGDLAQATSNIKQTWPSHDIIMRRAKREARSLFFLGFPGENKPLHNGSCEACRVPFFYFLCMFLCIRQHRHWPLRSTAFNAHGTNASPDGLCARTNNNEAFSCWSCCKSSELVEPGAATFVFRGMAGLCLKNLGLYVCTRYKYQFNTSIRVTCFFVLEKNLPSKASANNSIYR